MTFNLQAKTAALALAAAVLASVPAGAARAQDAFGSGSVFATGALDEFLRSGRNRDLNPTGFGRPGEYWSTPTGTRIARGPRPKPTTSTEAKASPPASPDAASQGAASPQGAATKDKTPSPTR